MKNLLIKKINIIPLEYIQSDFLNLAHKVAFTLAEVLIVLGIIGIIAEMTIPTLLKDTQDKELKVGWRAAYSILNQAYLQIKTDNSGDMRYQCADWDDICLKNLFAAKLRVIKNCNDAPTDGCTVSNSTYMDGTTQANSTNVNGDWPGIIMSNGMSVKFRYHTNACDYALPRQCGWMQVDVNGYKRPNVVGKDIFFISIAQNKLMPFGANGDTIASTDCGTGTDGMACSAKYLYQDN